MGFFSTEKPYTPNRVKSNLQQCVARLKLQHNKLGNLIKMERGKIAKVMKEQKFASARVQVESVVRMELKMKGINMVEHFAGILLNRLQPELYRNEDGGKQAVCPVELKEPITSLIWTASRLDTIPELAVVREEFGKLLGKDFIRMAQENSQYSVSDKLVEFLAPKVVPEVICIEYLRQLADEYVIADFDEEVYRTATTHGSDVSLDGAGHILSIPPIIVPRDALEERLLALKRQ